MLGGEWVESAGLGWLEWPGRGYEEGEERFEGEGLEGKGQGEFREWEGEVVELKAEAMLGGWRSSMMGSSGEMAVSDDMMDDK
jgi:hypothetical protein